MALGLLGLLFLLCIFLSIIGIFFVVLKNGYLLNKKWIFISLVIYCLLLSFIIFLDNINFISKIFNFRHEVLFFNWVI